MFEKGPHVVDDAYSGRAISESSYERKVQRIAGSWRGGARFTVRAKPRTEKLKFYVAHLAREADRFEFLLTGKDIH